MAKCAAEVINGQNNSAIVSLAKRGIRAAVVDLNNFGAFRFNIASLADVAFVADQATYSLDTSYFKMLKVQVVRNDADAKPYRTLRYVDWQEWQTIHENRTDEGIPELWTSKTPFSDENIQVYPIPNADVVTDYKLRITRYTRIARPDSDDTVIDAPEELMAALCAYAEYYVLFRKARNDRAAWLHKLGQYRELVDRFRMLVEDEPDQMDVFRIHRAGDDANINTDMYVKVR